MTKKKIRIMCTAQMGYGTFEAKFIPLSLHSEVEKIYVIRDSVGPSITKLEYIVIPRYISKFKPLKFIIPFLLAKYAKRYNCNFIIGYHIIPHAFFSFFASLISGIPFACAQTGILIQRQAQNFLFAKFLALILNRALFINVPGQFSKTFWIKFGVDSNKINVLHSTIDSDRFNNQNTIKEYDFIILSRLSVEKKIDHLLNIFYSLKIDGYNFSVCIAGDGPQRKHLENIAKKLEIDDIVKFVGFVNNPEDWLNKSRNYLLSSQSEGLPTALMQAMSCGLICVATNVGNISDTIKNGENGFLVNYGDLNAYRNILIQLIIQLESNKLKQISLNARNDAVKKHSFNYALREWDNVFDTFLGYNNLQENK